MATLKVTVALVAVLTCCILHITQGEMFTALVELQKVLTTEREIADDIRYYISLEEVRLQKLREIADDYDSHSTSASLDPEKHLSNPLNAFLLVKRFTTDWERVENLIRNNTADDFMTRLQVRAAGFPNQEDLNGAASALLRLQDTYALPTASIAEGKLSGIKDSQQLKLEDCFDLGRIAYNEGDFYHTILWMQESLGRAIEAANKMYQTEILDYLSYSTYMKGWGHVTYVHRRFKINDCFELGRLAYNEADYYHTVLWMEEALNRLPLELETPETLSFKALTLDYLSYSMSMQGNTRDAFNLTMQWLSIEPNHVRAQNNKKFYEQQLAIEEEERKKGDEGAPPKAFQNKRILDDYRGSEEFQTYERLCRGEDVFPYEHKHKLVCHLRQHEPIFYIRPLKEEVMYFDPYMVVYHDVMTDAEMNVIKTIAAPRLQRSGVFTMVEDQASRKHSKHRTSKSAWLHDWEDAKIAQVSTKVRYLSNLTMDTAEELQVVNYGIGGHYEPHYDFARKREKNSFENWRGNRIATAIFYKDEKGGFDPAGGNRIATAIFYMSDVEAGGATVFTTLGVRLWPEKGSVALWYNLRKSGEGDYNTRHAACPVLTGSKWVANKWIHERGQEFVRRCDPDPLL